MTAEEKLDRIRLLLRILLAPTRPRQGPIRLEAKRAWTLEQRAAYDELRVEAGLLQIRGGEPPA